jgi:uncharacterized membrane protein
MSGIGRVVELNLRVIACIALYCGHHRLGELVRALGLRRAQTDWSTVVIVTATGLQRGTEYWMVGWDIGWFCSLVLDGR